MEASVEQRTVVDADDYSVFVSTRWPVLLRSAVLLGCPLHEAEDLVQATLVKCYASWDKVTKADNRDAYVHRVLINTHVSNRRRWWQRERPSDQMADRPTPDDAEGLSELAHTVRRALEGLSRESRAVIVLRYIADFTEQETADVLRIPQAP